MRQPSNQPAHPALKTWQAVHQELRRRINEHIWPPGERVPTETDLAEEFGCARATVNRAMRELAGAGLLERRRKAGTRVVKTPVRRATLAIPITRLEVEQRGARWHHQILEKRQVKPPAAIASRLSLAKNLRGLHLRSLHFADSQPFVYEDRWINPLAVPGFDLDEIENTSANEWLVQHAPFSWGEFTVSAANANKEQAELLETSEGTAIVIIDRTTFNNEQAITCVRLAYAPGYRMHTTL